MREQARRSRRELEEVRELLLHPGVENLNLSRPILVRSIEGLQQVRDDLGDGGEIGMETRQEIEESARVSRQISLLLHHAWGVQLEWGRQLLATGDAYGADGTEARLAGTGHVDVAG